jgi:hypothetical protein
MVMDPVSEIVFKILEYLMMDKVLKPIDSDCYTPQKYILKMVI